MTPSFPITKERIRTHFTYSWWKYVLLVALSLLCWNLLHTTTAYRTPDHLKVEWYCEGFATPEFENLIDGYLAQVKAEILPDMEELTYTPVAYDDQYGDMQLMVWSMAGQGDLYLLSRERFEALCANGGMIPLQPHVDAGTLNVEGVDLQNGYFNDPDTGNKVLLGIPADTLTKLEYYGIPVEGRVFGVLTGCGNEANALKLLNYLLEDCRDQ